MSSSNMEGVYFQQMLLRAEDSWRSLDWILIPQKVNFSFCNRDYTVMTELETHNLICGELSHTDLQLYIGISNYISNKSNF